jgi:UDP-N-acetyl-2-amino-2-deoxyglucuronate dehydrogenase
VKRFALLGAAGYIAPRHMRAIKATGNRIVAAMDPSDSVGVIDEYFPEAAFFTEFERFDRHVDKLRRAGPEQAVDYVSICSPNYLHDAHIRFALRSGAAAICEKPLVINPWNLEGIREIERESGGRLFTILQLRLHPAIVALKERVASAIAADPNARFDIKLNYVTSRGAWYFTSWKGDERKSGGIAVNIGIHFFDMLLWIFGPVVEHEVEMLRPDRAKGELRFANANARWFLSVNARDLPEAAQAAGQRTFRSVSIDGDELEFSGGFTDLHTASYERILAGEGFGIDDAERSIALVRAIRDSKPERADER